MSSCVLLCREKSIYGGMIVKHAIESGLNLDAVILQDWGTTHRVRRLWSYARRYGLAATVSSKIILLLDDLLLSQSRARHATAEDLISAHSLRSIPVPTLNGQATLDVLDDLRPTVLLLGGVGIVSEKLIMRAGRAVLNAHPGLLPKYRGNYVIRWALLENSPIFISVHLVDEGIDTGKPLSTALVNIPKTRSLLDIENFVEVQRAAQLVAVAKKYISGVLASDDAPMRSEVGKVYSLMPTSQLLQVYREKLWNNAYDS